MQHNLADGIDKAHESQGSVGSQDEIVSQGECPADANSTVPSKAGENGQQCATGTAGVDGCLKACFDAIEASIMKNDVSGLQILLDDGADINSYIETDRLETPLHICSRMGFQECATVLLNHATKTQVDILLAWNAECKTPLRVAEDHGNANVAALLRAYPLQRRIGSQVYKEQKALHPPPETEPKP